MASWRDHWNSEPDYAKQMSLKQDLSLECPLERTLYASGGIIGADRTVRAASSYAGRTPIFSTTRAGNQIRACAR